MLQPDSVDTSLRLTLYLVTLVLGTVTPVTRVKNQGSPDSVMAPVLLMVTVTRFHPLDLESLDWPLVAAPSCEVEGFHHVTQRYRANCHLLAVTLP